MTDDKQSLIEKWNKLEKILLLVFEKYKDNFAAEEKELYNDLISNREYGEGFENLVAIIKLHNIPFDEETKTQLRDAAELMSLVVSDYDLN